MKAAALLHVSLNVADLARAEAFYTAALGFRRESPPETALPVIAALLGVRRLRTIRLRRGGQTLELAECAPQGEPMPAGRGSNDLCFQHIALATTDIGGDVARLAAHRFTPISVGGPQTLPGGIAAFKFRDPEGHPLELIQFPAPDPRTAGGIDHSAIAVADAARSTAFYAAALGLAVTARQTNTGPAQDALDGLTGTIVDVVALAPAQPAPHLELLAYRAPRGRLAHTALADRAASRLVFSADFPAPALLRDPDGHVSLLLPAEIATLEC